MNENSVYGIISFQHYNHYDYRHIIFSIEQSEKLDTMYNLSLLTDLLSINNIFGTVNSLQVMSHKVDGYGADGLYCISTTLDLENRMLKTDDYFGMCYDGCHIAVYNDKLIYDEFLRHIKEDDIIGDITCKKNEFKDKMNELSPMFNSLPTN